MKPVELLKLEECLLAADTRLDDEQNSGAPIGVFHREVRRMLQVVTTERIRAEHQEPRMAEKPKSQQNGSSKNLSDW